MERYVEWQAEEARAADPQLLRFFKVVDARVYMDKVIRRRPGAGGRISQRAWCRGSLALSDCAFNALRDRGFQCRQLGARFRFS